MTIVNRRQLAYGVPDVPQPPLHGFTCSNYLDIEVHESSAVDLSFDHDQVSDADGHSFVIGEEETLST